MKRKDIITIVVIGPREIASVTDLREQAIKMGAENIKANPDAIDWLAGNNEVTDEEAAQWVVDALIKLWTNPEEYGDLGTVNYENKTIFIASAIDEVGIVMDGGLKAIVHAHDLGIFDLFGLQFLGEIVTY